MGDGITDLYRSLSGMEGRYVRVKKDPAPCDHGSKGVEEEMVCHSLLPDHISIRGQRWSFVF